MERQCAKIFRDVSVTPEAPATNLTDSEPMSAANHVASPEHTRTKLWMHAIIRIPGGSSDNKKAHHPTAMPQSEAEEEGAMV